MCQAVCRGPTAIPSSGTVLCQEPRQVQTNLVNLSPHLGLALKDTTDPGQWINSSFLQQSNVHPWAGRPWGKARKPTVQQSNLDLSGTTGPHLQDSFRQRTRLSHCLRQVSPATDVPSPDCSFTVCFVPFDGCAQPGPKPWRGLGSRASRPVGEPLTLEDLTVPAQNQGLDPSPTAIRQLLASVSHLERKVAHLGYRAFQDPPGLVQQDPGSSQAPPSYPHPCQPVLAPWDEKKRCTRSPKETACLLEMPEGQSGLADSQAQSQPVSPKTTWGMVSGSFLDSEQGVLPTQPLGPGEKCPLSPTFGRRHRGTPRFIQGEPRLGSSASSGTAQRVLPGQEGERVPGEQANTEEKKTFSPPATVAAPAWRSAWQVEAQGAGLGSGLQ